MEDSSSSEPPLCPCGYWGSAKTLGLCSKCYLEKSVQGGTEALHGSDLGCGRVSCTQPGSKAASSSSLRMDSNSKHCPSRTDNLSKQPGCGEDAKDKLPTSCATASTVPTTDDPAPCDPSTPRPPSSSRSAEEVSTPQQDAKEDCVSGASQSADRSPACQVARVGQVTVAAGTAEAGANERLSGKPPLSSPQVAAASNDPPMQDQESSVDVIPPTEPVAQGTKRSHADMEREDASCPSPVKQKKKSRCFKCNCKLDLAKQAIGLCKCGLVFCSEHRHPEKHECQFDHKEDGRREAKEKMVKPTRHLGAGVRRLDSS